MKEIIKTISLDLWRKSNTRLVFAKQNDRLSRKVKVELTAGGEPYKVSDDTIATVNVKRSDGSSQAFAADITDDGCVMVTLSFWMLAYPGITNCCIALFDANSNKLSSANFSLEVDEALYLENSISTDSNYSLLTSMMSKISHYSLQEDGRVAAESERKLAESQRVSAETARQAAEEQRVIEYENRALAETDRELAETDRQGAEADRQRVEAARVAAEAERALAEETRIEAEKRREERLAGFGRAEGIAISDERGNYDSSDLEGAIGEIADRFVSLEIKESDMTANIEGIDGRMIASEQKIASAEEAVISLNKRIGEAEKNIGALYGNGGTVTLLKTDFDSSLVLNVKIDGLRDCDAVFFSPASASDRETINKAGLFLSPSNENSVVSFSVTKIPDKAVSLYYFICRGSVQ